MSSKRTRAKTGTKRRKKTKKEEDAEAEARTRGYAEDRAFYERRRREKTGIPSGRAMGAQILGNCDEAKLAQEKTMLVTRHGAGSPCLALDTNLSCPQNYKKAKKKLTRLHPDKNTGCEKLSEE